MLFQIITSTKDPAGVNIYNTLLSSYNFKDSGEKYKNNPIFVKDNLKLVIVEEETLNCNDIDKELEADIFIFATRHQSVEKKPCLTCHTPGNWDKAEYGGREKELCIAPANLLKAAYLKLKELNDLEGFATAMECTHHGPFIQKPCIFIEIGSSKEEWDNKRAAEIISKTIIKITKTPLKQQNAVMGIGGPHYCNNFNKLLERADYAVGHVCPKYMLDRLDEEMVIKAIKRTYEKPVTVVLDWKGLGKEKRKIVEILEKNNIKSERIDNLI